MMQKEITFTDYRIADMSEEEVKNIGKLEQQLSSSAKEEIVLIAYKHSPDDSSNNYRPHTMDLP